jgi:hypothetical protein
LFIKGGAGSSKPEACDDPPARAPVQESIQNHL